MPTDQATALEARARRSFVAPRDLGHAAEGDELVLKINNDGHQVRKELLVLNTAGEWQPALSLFEYVQQSLVELCAGYIEVSEDDGSYSIPLYAWRVYVEQVCLTRDIALARRDGVEVLGPVRARRAITGMASR